MFVRESVDRVYSTKPNKTHMVYALRSEAVNVGTHTRTHKINTVILD